MVQEDDFERFTIPVGSLSLLSGEELDPTAFLAFKTYGSLNAKRSNAILWVTCYNQRHTEMAPMIGRGKRFDPDTTGHFLITVNMPGNGMSWSPTSPGARWPKGGLTYHDCAAMVQLLVQSFGVEQLALIYGFSMGAMFALEYCVQFPRGAAAAVVVCGSARTNPANEYFLRTLHDTLRADPEAEVDGDGEIRGFGGNPRPAGMLEFASVYADWVVDGPRPGGPSPDASRPTYAISKPGARCYSEGLYKTQFGVVRHDLRVHSDAGCVCG
jgi:homoserine O-acetyltransferase